ncbi:CocE/NonD family hydrolase [Nocardia lijiangensis]|uniref:CocE/NonD family hydrolase n=1 Tax=Nocardia lijiangensis TaxID=299618 RepID=UPI000AE72F4B|nr:CocE/NonD family hydrolase [Nocardia lijiangensis]
MSQAHQDRLRLLSSDQETDVDAVVRDLLTGDAAGVPADLVDDIAAVRTQCRLGTEKIPGAGGVLLDAFAAWPLTGGPHPLIILPAGLDPSGWKMYGGAIIRLLMRRYAVVAYTERGLPGSEGELTVAGPEDIADGRKVVDWALANSRLDADQDAIGMLGISYGSGISQLVANADRRVKAVVALSTWADLGEALYDNQTRHIMAAEALAAISDRPSDELVKVLDDFRKNTNIEGVLEWTKPRSPAHLNSAGRQSVPTFFTSYWHETIFPQNQLLDYFDRYTGPKRLDLAIGDHGAVEIPGLTLGVYTRTTEAAYDWLDHHLRGVDNGIDRDGVVHTETMDTFVVKAAADLKSWSKSMLRYYLTAPSGGSTDGTLTAVPTPEYSQSIQAGTEQVQAASTLVFDGFLERLLMPKRQLLDDVDRSAAAVWTTESLPRPQRIAGAPEVQVTVTPSGKTVTVIAYLLDLNPFTGKMRVITHAAVTVKNAEAGRPEAVNVRLQAADYWIPAGHKLTMIVDTKDHLYGDETVAGSTVTLSDERGPAYVDLPMSS